MSEITQFVEYVEYKMKKNGFTDLNINDIKYLAEKYQMKRGKYGKDAKDRRQTL